MAGTMEAEGRRVGLRHRGSTRFAMVAGAFLVTGLAILVLGLVRLEQMGGEVDELGDQGLPARRSLATAMIRLSEMELLAEQVVHAEESDVRIEQVALFFSLLEEYRTAMSRFDEVSLGIDGEMAARTRLDELFDQALALADDASAELIGGTDRAAVASDERIVALGRTVEQGRVAMGELLDLYTAHNTASLDATSGAIDSLQRDILIAFVVLVALVQGAAWASVFRMRRQEQALVARSQAQEEERRWSALEARLQGAMTMAEDETRALDVLRRTLTHADPGLGTRVLLAGPDGDSHLAEVVVLPEGGECVGCGVADAMDCPAIRQSRRLEFPDGEAFDACPHLRDIDGVSHGATCVPISIGGTTLGVAHIPHTPDGGVDPNHVRAVELATSKVGDRLAVLRAFAQTSQEARHDPLTGMHNRRSLDEQLRRLGPGRSYAVLYADLDRFKLLNDTYGHQVGDRCLLVFSEAIERSVRTQDLGARYGGEEFVVVLPDASLAAAEATAERIRATLASMLEAEEVPSFTVSIGVAIRQPGEAFEEPRDRADQALHHAKEHGRNRVMSNVRLDGENAVVNVGPSAR